MSNKVFFEFNINGKQCKLQGADPFADGTLFTLSLFVNGDGVTSASLTHARDKTQQELDDWYDNEGLAVINDYIASNIIGGDIPEAPESGIERLLWMVEHGTELSNSNLVRKQ